MRKLLVASAIVLAACSDEPTPPLAGDNVTPLTIPARDVPDFFTAFSWYGNNYTTPIRTIQYDASQCPENPRAVCLTDAAYQLQWNDVLDWQPVATFAATHPGHLYIVGDGLHDDGYAGRYNDDTDLLAKEYCDFVRNVRAKDPTSKFTPGLIEPWAADTWLNAFAQAMVAQVQAGTCSTRPIAEWDFNMYGAWSQGLQGIESYVNTKEAWAMSLPAPVAAPIMLSAWTMGFGADDIPNDHPDYLARLRQFKAFLFAHENIVGSRALAFEPWAPDNPDPHPLADKNGSLNATGKVYAEVTGRIAGPTIVRPGSSCSWVVEKTGGSAPFSYKWLSNGAVVAAAAAVSVVEPAAAFTLELVVTDGTGGHNSARIDVAISADAPVCN
jgi:hypothetical protein